jgi:hypothetical protein
MRVLAYDYLPSIRELREPFGAHHDWFGRLWLYALKNDLSFWELLTQESVNAWADYLASRYAAGQVDVLEVGAGNGRLTHFLGLALEQRRPGQFRIRATDDGSWQTVPAYPVEQLSAAAAIERYRPQVVIACWSKIVRLQNLCAPFEVAEILMIGEPALCESMVHVEYGETAPTQVGGYTYVTLDDIARLQHCRTDDTVLGWHNQRSSTQSFRLVTP